MSIFDFASPLFTVAPLHFFNLCPKILSCRKGAVRSCTHVLLQVLLFCTVLQRSTCLLLFWPGRTIFLFLSSSFLFPWWGILSSHVPQRQRQRPCAQAPRCWKEPGVQLPIDVLLFDKRPPYPPPPSLHPSLRPFTILSPVIEEINVCRPPPLCLPLQEKNGGGLFCPFSQPAALSWLTTCACVDLWPPQTLPPHPMVRFRGDWKQWHSGCESLDDSRFDSYSWAHHLI